jgi:solute carrier family 13 (sodium-dependent dicarboxylate transporter), member 2/3/5
MNDSRNASRRLIRMERVVNYQSRIIFFLSSILLAQFLTFQLGDESFSATQNYVLFLLFFSIGLWVTEAIPPFAVGIMIVGFLVFFLGSDYFNTQPESVKKYVNTWSDSVMWLMLGGFFLAEGMKKAGLDISLFRYAIRRFGTKPDRLLLGIMLTTCVISMVMSNTATCAMMLVMISPLLSSLEKEANYSKALLLGIAAAATLGGMGTIIGSPPNAIAVGSLETLGYKISFTKWMLYGVPISLVLMYFTWKLLCKKFPAEISEVDLSLIPINEQNAEDEIDTYARKIKRNIMLSIFGITALLWLTSNIHGIPVAAVAGIPIILLTMLGIINGDDVRQLPWETLMLVAGGLSLGLAIKETGLAA